MKNSITIWQSLSEISATGTAAALVTVVATKGSTPRETGAKMIVKGDGSIVGTIGGSVVEAKVIEEARKVIARNKACRVTYDLNDPDKKSTGMICGGQMEFFIEPVSSGPRLLIFGGGHVGLAVARLSSLLGYSHVIFEERQEFTTTDRFPNASEIISGSYSDIAESFNISATDYIIIVTHSHDCDAQVLRAVSGKNYGYLGMICSKKKRKEIFQKLIDEGFSGKELEQIHAPIGLSIGAKSPAEIAVSIMAEIVGVYYKTLT